MKREISDRNILDRFVLDFSSIVEPHCKYIVVSGFVSISHGRSRGTEDIDMIIDKLDFEDFLDLHLDLVKSGFECLQGEKAKTVYEYLIEGDSVRYIREGEYLPEMELKFAKDEIDRMQLDSRVKLPLSGLNIWFSSIEANVAFKEELLKSDKDLEDARHLRIIYSEKIDEDLINKFKIMIKQIRLGR